MAKGVRTSRRTAGLAHRCKVDMPIVQAVCAVLFEDKSPRLAVSELMERAAKRRQKAEKGHQLRSRDAKIFNVPDGKGRVWRAWGGWV